MDGTLRKIEITDDLIMKVAREEFNKLNDGILDDQSEYDKGIWLNDAIDMLEDFNDLTIIFKKIDYQCHTDNFGKYHDVNKFYKE